MKQRFVMFFLLFGMMLSAVQIHFVIGSSELSVDSINELKNFKQEFEEFLVNNPRTKIIISGYTDNTGSQESNIKLSFRRTEIVKNFLVNNLDFDPQYIQTFGRGPANPIASNKTPAGRNMNRRVEIIFDKPEARIKWFRNDVTYIPSRSGDILSAIDDAELFQNDKINTRKKSRSGILFQDNNLLILEENSLMVIYGDITSKSTKLLENKFHVELKSGRLFNKLENLKDSSINVKTPAADLVLFSAENEVQYTENSTLASIYEGYGLVLAQGKEVKVEEGFGLKVELGQEPQDPRQLPEIPLEFLLSNREPELNGEKVYFEWQTNQATSRILIASDEDFENIISMEKVFGKNFEIILESGNYYAKVKALDNEGFSSEFSQTIQFQINQTELISLLGLEFDKVNKLSSKEFVLSGSVVGNISVEIDGDKVDLESDGNFRFPKDLNEGINEIMISVLDTNDQQKEYNLKIDYTKPVYTEPKFKALDPNLVNQVSTPIYNLFITIPTNCKILYKGEEYLPDWMGNVSIQTKLEKGINNVEIEVIHPDGTQKISYLKLEYVKEDNLLMENAIIIVIGIILFITPVFF